MVSRNSNLNLAYWTPRVLFLGTDLSFEKLIAEAFEKNISYLSVRSSVVAAKLLDQNIYDVILIDEEIFNVESFEGRVSVNLSEIYQLAMKRLPKVTFIIFYVKKNTFVKSFEKINVSTLLYEREKASPSRISFSINFLRRRYYRSIFIIDLFPGQKFDFDIYRYNYDKKQYEVLFNRGETLPPNFRDLSASKQFYVRTSIFQSLDDGIIAKLSVTKHFDAIRKLYKYIFINLIDDCGVGDLKKGQELRDVAQKIIKFLIAIINKYKNEYSALEEMPYSINSILAHGISSATYCLIFSKILWGSYNEEMAIAGLLHELGLSSVDFHLLNRDEDHMTISEKISFEHHIKETCSLLRKKMFRSSAIIDECILGHHETLDGMGHPKGLEERNFSPELKLFSICYYFERIRCTSSKSSLKGLEETLRYIKHIPCTLKDTPKFDEKILNQLMLKFEELKKKNKEAA